MDLEYETKKTITEVLDVETGEIIKSEDFFIKPESEIIKYRRRLAEAIGGYSKPKFVCAYCNQMLKLSGRATKRGEVSFFSHLKDSDDCEIKTNGEYSKEEIEIRKYSNIRESLRHKTLKNEIATALKGQESISKGVSNVEIEKRITSSVPYLYWRQPDISADYNGNKIVFELQLSTTFLSTIIDRDIFYRLNNIFIVWVFNFSDNTEFVNLGNLMCKDIYYANKRNIFIFDETARNLSKQEGQLVLLCAWFEPEIKEGVFHPDIHIKKQCYIRLEDLKFDNDVFKPFYIDADILYVKFQPELNESRSALETLTLQRLKRKQAIQAEKLEIKERNAELISIQKDKIRNGLEIPKPFEKNNKWGYACDSVIIVEPIYQEVTEFTDQNIAFVKRYNKYGVINKVGEFILHCNYKEVYSVFENQFLFNEKNVWYFRDFKKNKSVLVHELKDNKSVIDIVKLSPEAYFISIEYTVGVLHCYYGFTRYFGIEKSDFQHNEVEAERYQLTENYFGRSNKYSSRGWNRGYNRDRKSVFLDKYGVEKIYLKKSVGIEIYLGSHYDKWGVFNENSDNIVPFIYDEMEVVGHGKLKVKKDYYYGIIDLNGNFIVPLEYTYLGFFIDGIAKVGKDSLFGFIDENNNIIIPMCYDSVEDFSEGIVVVEMNGMWGCVDGFNNIVIPIEYEFLGVFIDNKVKARKNECYGYLDRSNSTLIPFEYEELSEFINGKAIAKKNGFFGVVGLANDVIIPFEFQSLYFSPDDRFVARKNNFFGLLDFDNVTVIPFVYDRLEYDSNEKICVWKKGEKGFLDSNGFELFEDIIPISNSFFKGLNFGKFWILDKDQVSVFDFGFDKVDKFEKGYSKITLNRGAGLLNEKCQGFYFYRISKEFIGKYGETIKEYFYGIKSLDGKEIHSPVFNDFEILENGLTKVFKSKLFIGMQNGYPKFRYRFGVVNELGDLIVPAEFESVEINKAGKIIAKKNNVVFEYDRSGSCDRDSSLDTKKYFTGSIHYVKVSRIVNYGFFVKFIDGNSSLLHISELNKSKRKLEEFFVDQDVMVKVLSIDSEKNRLIVSLVG